MSHYYTGVGSRETPPEVLSVMKALATYLAKRGMVLRSGGAQGADTAFEQGSDLIDPKRKEIYLPWPGFNSRHPKQPGVLVVKDPQIHLKASQIAQHIHPAWDKLSQGAQALHTRNIYQVLGQDIQTPSRFLVCWAPLNPKDNTPKGGTRTAVMLARQSHIRAYNLSIEADFRHVQSVLKSVASG